MDIVEAPCEHKVVTDRAAKRLSRERDNLIASFRAINDMGDYANELILDARKRRLSLLNQRWSSTASDLIASMMILRRCGHESGV